MITMEQLAKKTGYSQSTVSKAINGYPDISEKARKKILKVADELGFAPNANAQNLVKRRSKTIGVVYDVGLGLKNSFFSAILESFRSEIEQRGYDLLMLSNYTENGMDYLKHCRAKQVDAVLVVAGNDNQSLKRLLDSDVSVLVFDPKEAMSNSIASNGYMGIRKSLEYLYELGHRKIAFVHGGTEIFIGKERIRAFLDFTNEHDLKQYWVPEYPNDLFNDEEGNQTIKALYERYDTFDAICCASDLMAIGVYKYLKDQSMTVPADVSVIGFDDLLYCDLLDPRLTTIRQDYGLIGQQACEILLKAIKQNEMQKEPVFIEPKLIIRDSCRRLKR